jgi:hypothetical protein
MQYRITIQHGLRRPRGLKKQVNSMRFHCLSIKKEQKMNQYTYLSLFTPVDDVDKCFLPSEDWLAVLLNSLR